MFGHVAPSPYDINFSVGPFPVRVTWTHWLISALLGWGSVNYAGAVGLGEPGVPQPIFVVAWIIVLFVSILVHELGHAVAARSFGYPVEIVLHHFGGYASFQPRGHTVTREIIVSAAGPAAGFVLYGLVWIAAVYGLPYVPPMESDLARAIVRFTFEQMIFVNLIWGFINLLPVLPLDGGRISQALCVAVNRHEGPTWSLWISTGAAALAAVYLWKIGYAYGGMMFLFLGVQSWLALTGRSLR